MTSFDPGPSSIDNRPIAPSEVDTEKLLTTRQADYLIRSDGTDFYADGRDETLASGNFGHVLESAITSQDAVSIFVADAGTVTDQIDIDPVQHRVRIVGPGESAIMRSDVGAGNDLFHVDPSADLLAPSITLHGLVIAHDSGRDAIHLNGQTNNIARHTITDVRTAGGFRHGLYEVGTCFEGRIHQMYVKNTEKESFRFERGDGGMVPVTHSIGDIHDYNNTASGGGLHMNLQMSDIQYIHSFGSENEGLLNFGKRCTYGTVYVEQASGHGIRGGVGSQSSYGYLYSDQSGKDGLRFADGKHYVGHVEDTGSTDKGLVVQDGAEVKVGFEDVTSKNVANATTYKIL